MMANEPIAVALTGYVSRAARRVDAEPETQEPEGLPAPELAETEVESDGE